MRKTRTFLDSGVLISAHRGEPEIRRRALSLLDDPRRSFITSDFVRLELLPKPVFNRRPVEVSFYEAFFTAANRQPVSRRLLETAFSEACKWGLSAADALHVAAAKLKGCKELHTTETEGKPLFRVKGIKIISLV